MSTSNYLRTYARDLIAFIFTLVICLLSSLFLLFIIPKFLSSLKFHFLQHLCCTVQYRTVQCGAILVMERRPSSSRCPALIICSCIFIFLGRITTPKEKIIMDQGCCQRYHSPIGTRKADHLCALRHPTFSYMILPDSLATKTQPFQFHGQITQDSMLRALQLPFIQNASPSCNHLRGQKKIQIFSSCISQFVQTISPSFSPFSSSIKPRPTFSLYVFHPSQQTTVL